MDWQLDVNFDFFIGLINECEVTPEQFMDALHNLQDRDDDAKFYVEMILSVTSYENFVNMMKHYKHS